MKQAVVLATLSAALLLTQGSYALANQPRVIAQLVSNIPTNSAGCETRELQVFDNGLVITTTCGQNATTVLKLSDDGFKHLKENRAGTLRALMRLATALSLN